jgi:hypothetical protein
MTRETNEDQDMLGGPRFEILIEEGMKTTLTRFRAPDGTIRINKRQFPDAISHPYPGNSTTDDIILYSGQFRFEGDAPNCEYHGDIRLSWLPRPRITARGWRDQSVKETALSWLEDSNDKWRTVPKLDPSCLAVLPEPPLTDAGEWPNKPGSVLVTDQIQTALAGPDIPVSQVTFGIANGWIGYDATALFDPANPEIWWYGRLESSSKDWHITIDRRNKFDQDALARLEEERGSAVTHFGRLERIGKSEIRIDDARQVLDDLRVLLSLAMGRKTDLILPVGWNQGSTTWSIWANPVVDYMRNSQEWLDDTTSNSQISTLMSCGLDYLANSHHREVIRYANSYYLTMSGKIDAEAGVAIAVSGLQLLAYERLVEEKKQYSKRKWEKLDTGEQIRLLLDDSEIDYSIPEHFIQIWSDAKYSTTTSGALPDDALKLLISMRNHVIHPTRTKPSRWTFYQWVEIYMLAKEFLLLAILNTLDYKGKYRSIKNMPQPHGAPLDVPWTNCA